MGWLLFEVVEITNWGARLPQNRFGWRWLLLEKLWTPSLAECLAFFFFNLLRVRIHESLNWKTGYHSCHLLVAFAPSFLKEGGESGMWPCYLPPPNNPPRPTVTDPSSILINHSHVTATILIGWFLWRNKLWLVQKLYRSKLLVSLATTRCLLADSALILDNRQIIWSDLNNLDKHIISITYWNKNNF